MSVPGYAQIEEPLLCYIYLCGDAQHEVVCNQTYQPPAEYFQLSPSEQQRTRHDGRVEPLWNNMVQWARRKLKEKGYLVSSRHGYWKLTAQGIVAAKAVSHKYSVFRN